MWTDFQNSFTKACPRALHHCTGYNLNAIDKYLQIPSLPMPYYYYYYYFNFQSFI